MSDQNSYGTLLLTEQDAGSTLNTHWTRRRSFCGSGLHLIKPSSVFTVGPYLISSWLKWKKLLECALLKGLVVGKRYGRGSCLDFKIIVAFYLQKHFCHLKRRDQVGPSARADLCIHKMKYQLDNLQDASADSIRTVKMCEAYWDRLPHCNRVNSVLYPHATAITWRLIAPFDVHGVKCRQQELLRCRPSVYVSVRCFVSCFISFYQFYHTYGVKPFIRRPVKRSLAAAATGRPLIRCNARTA